MAMASGANPILCKRARGYPLELIPEPARFDYICVSCKLILRKAHLLFCGHLICHECISDNRQADTRIKCVECVSDSSIRDACCNETDITPYYAIINSNKKVKCPFNPCDFTCSYSSYESHYVNCIYNKVDCNCGSKIPYKLRKTHKHVDDSIPCPLQCGQQILPAELDEHLSAYLSTHMLSLHQQSGGTETQQLTTLNENFVMCEAALSVLSRETEHNDAKIKELERQVKTLTDVTASQDNKIRRLNEQIVTLNTKLLSPPLISRNGTLMWIVNNISEEFEKTNNATNYFIRSLPFYSSENGYKIRGRIYFKGNSDAKNKYISVVIEIQPGEFDVILTWPITKKFTLSCLDQNTNEYYNESFVCDPTSNSFKQPSDNKPNIAAGVLAFMPLNVYTSTEKGYIKNNTSVFKIAITG
jgi:TNF receptor-associated factor 4